MNEKADRPPAETSLAHVAQLGAAAVHAERLDARFAGHGRQHMPLTTRKGAAGLPELVHAETGDVLGICASSAIADRTRAFFR